MTVEQHWQPTGRSRDASWIQFTRRRWLNYWRRWRWGGDVVMGTGLIGMGKFDRDELGWHGKNHGDGVGIGTIYFTVSLSCSHQMPFFSYRIHQIQFWLELNWSAQLAVGPRSWLCSSENFFKKPCPEGPQSSMPGAAAAFEEHYFGFLYI